MLCLGLQKFFTSNVNKCTFVLIIVKCWIFFIGKYAILEVLWNSQIIFIIVICSIIFVLSNISLHGICSITFTSH